MDGRADVYGDQLLQMYVGIIGLHGDPQVTFDRYGIDYAVFPPDTPLADWFDASASLGAGLPRRDGRRLGASLMRRDLAHPLRAGARHAGRRGAPGRLPALRRSGLLPAGRRAACRRPRLQRAGAVELPGCRRQPAGRPDPPRPEQRPLDAAHLDRRGGIDRRLRRPARAVARRPAADDPDRARRSSRSPTTSRCDLWGSRFGAWIAALLVLAAGPLLVMAPLVDAFAVFGAAGAAAIWCSIRAVRARAARSVARGWRARASAWPRWRGSTACCWRSRRPRPGRCDATGRPGRRASAGGPPASWPPSSSCPVAGAGPGRLRQPAPFRRRAHPVDHQLQPAVLDRPATRPLADYLAWGPVNIIGSKLAAWGELVGRTAVLLGGIFILPFAYGLWRERRRAELPPVPRLLRGDVRGHGRGLHLPRPEGRLLPLVAGLAAVRRAAGRRQPGPAATAAGRAWPFLRRPATHRFLAVAGLVGAFALSLAGSAVLHRPVVRRPRPAPPGRRVPRRPRRARRRS